MKRNILFVCSGNKDRSPTAEKIFKKDPRFIVRSAGINENARHILTERMLMWADYIFVMTKLHRRQILSKFHKLDKGIDNKIKCLGIPDRYDYMDQKLVNLIKVKIHSFFNH